MIFSCLGTLLTTSEIFSDCIPTIRKLLNIELKLLHMEGAQMWNLVPESMRNTPSSNTFLKKLKTEMLTYVHIEFVRHVQRLVFILIVKYNLYTI